MIRKIGLYIIFLLSISTRLFAIEASASHAVFFMPAADDKLKPYVEVYWQINPHTINYTINEDSLWTAKVITSLSFLDMNGKPVLEDKYIMQTNPVALNSIFNQSILELHRYEIPEGKYKIRLELTDVTLEENKYHYMDSITITSPGNSPYYGSVQVLDTVFNSEKASVFQRNKRQQIPLCFNFLDERKTLYFYTELYRSDAVKSNLPLVQYISVTKSPGGKPLFRLQQVDTIIPGRIIPFLGKFNLEKLPSGNYYLDAALYDKQSLKKAENSVFFQLVNSTPVASADDTGDTELKFEKVEIFDLGNTFVSKYNVPQLMAILKMISPVSTPLEMNSINSFLKKPDETYMRYFIYNFFQERNKNDPKKAWDEYANRVREVNKLFGSGALPGYETDRGVIWLKYGKPDERLNVQNERGVLPYEVWKYNAPGRQSSPGVFLFYMPGYMVNDYRLLHSTVTGEMRNLNWRSQLYTSGSSSGNLNSRAEQYIGDK